MADRIKKRLHFMVVLPGPNNARVRGGVPEPASRTASLRAFDIPDHLLYNRNKLGEWGMTAGCIAHYDRALPLSGRAAIALVVLLVSCAGGPRPPISLPGPERPAERVGPWQTTIALYDPVLFGPERPLAELIERHRLALDDGKLKNARLVVNKAQRRLELWVRRTMVKAYRIQLGLNAHGPKRRQGDRRVPEGTYYICAHRPSAYYLGLWLAYPNAEDARRGLAAGLIEVKEYKAILERLANHACPPMNTNLGGEILLHGQPSEFTEELARAQGVKPGTLLPGLRAGDADPSKVREFQDWTDGCIAMFNPDIRELYEFVPDGAEVVIVANAAATAPRELRSLGRRRS